MIKTLDTDQELHFQMETMQLLNIRWYTF
jgi:hypothetical protein